MPDPNDLIARLDTCPSGTTGWVEFEDVCVEKYSNTFFLPS